MPRWRLDGETRAGAGGARAGAVRVSNADIQRLQDPGVRPGIVPRVALAGYRRVASRLQDDLDDLRDEVVYLKVKLRKEGSVQPRSDASRAAGSTSGSPRARRERLGQQRTSGSSSRQIGRSSERSSATAAGDGARVAVAPRPARTIPGRQEIDVRLQTELTSDTAQVEDRFEATTVVDLYRGRRRADSGRLGDARASSRR